MGGLIRSVAMNLISLFALREACATTVCDEAPDQAIVPLLYDSETPIGSGVLLTQDGYIVTALHVVEDVLEVRVLMPGGDDLRTAVVLSADELADLAILKANAAATGGVPVTMPGPSQGGLELNLDEICVVGYKIKELGGGLRKFDPLDKKNYSTLGNRGGFLRFDGEVEEGFSGGGAFMADGRLIGITQRSSRYGSRVLPFQHVWPFLLRLGLQADGSGRVLSGPSLTDISSLAAKLENTQKNVEKIMHSVEWHAEAGDGRSGLVIGYEPILPVQRVEGWISGEAIPLFGDAAFEEYVKKNGFLTFEIYGPINDRKVQFLSGQHAIDEIIGRYKDEGIMLDRSDLKGITLRFEVKSSDGSDVLESVEIEIGLDDG